MKQTILILGLITVALFLVGCSKADIPIAAEPEVPAEQAAPTPPMPPAANWRTAEFTDAVSGETFTIDSLPKPVLLESFAVWCPTCLKQQQIMGEVAGVTHVSIDTDPNEDVGIVKQHVQKHGFEWRFSVSPGSATQSLIDEFGIGVVNAPGVPIVLVCDDGARLLNRGLKQADKLKAEIAAGCSA